MYWKGSQRKFKAIHLSEGEDFVTDFGGSLTVKESTADFLSKQSSQGRFRICSKSVIFESTESPDLLKFPFGKIERMEFEGKSLVVLTSLVTVVPISIINGKARVVSPHINNSGVWKFLITPSHDLDFESVAAKTLAIWQAHKLPRFEAEDMINEIINQPTSTRHNDYSTTKGGAPTQGSSSEPSAQITQSIRGVFDYSCFVHHREVPLLSEPVGCLRVSKMLESRGILQITFENIYFQPSPNYSNKKCKIIPLDRVVGIFRRKFKLQDHALEILIAHSHIIDIHSSTDALTMPTNSQTHNSQTHNSQTHNSQVPTNNATINQSEGVGFLFVFSCKNERERVMASLPTLRIPPPPPVNVVAGLWADGLISNFHYLHFLNFASGRSFNDLSQYPVFPWTLKPHLTDDPTTAETPASSHPQTGPTTIPQSTLDRSSLDLSDRRWYRDLSKPCGALNSERLAKMLKTRGEDAEFLFGTHYSTPAYVLYFLIRKFPECSLRLQSGHFDNKNRLFHSILGAWDNIEQAGATMELIPEFYTLDTCGSSSSVSTASSGTNVGRSVNASTTTATGGVPTLRSSSFWLNNPLGVSGLSDVILPKWAESSSHFVACLRSALESPIVSEQLNEWIDLIFGFKSRGPNARASNNLFHPVTYLEDLYDVEVPGGHVMNATGAAAGASYGPGSTSNSSTRSDDRSPSKLNLSGHEIATRKQQVAEFGKTPDQLFALPHVKRKFIPNLKLPHAFMNDRVVVSWREAVDKAFAIINKPTPAPQVFGRSHTTSLTVGGASSTVEGATGVVRLAAQHRSSSRAIDSSEAMRVNTPVVVSGKTQPVLELVETADLENTRGVVGVSGNALITLDGVVKFLEISNPKNPGKNAKAVSVDAGIRVSALPLLAVAETPLGIVAAGVDRKLHVICKCQGLRGVVPAAHLDTITCIASLTHDCALANNSSALANKSDSGCSICHNSQDRLTIIATGSNDETVRVFVSNSGNLGNSMTSPWNSGESAASMMMMRQIGCLEGHDAEITCLSVLKAGQHFKANDGYFNCLIISGDSSGLLKVWDFKLKSVQSNICESSDFRFSNQKISCLNDSFVGFCDGTVLMLDIRKGVLTGNKLLQCPGCVVYLAQAHTYLIIVANVDESTNDEEANHEHKGVIMVWSFHSKSVVQQIAVEEKIRCASYRDGRLFLFTGNDQIITFLIHTDS